jgi:hypothetical protein
MSEAKRHEFLVIQETFFNLVACTSLIDEKASCRVPTAGTSMGWHISDTGFSDTGSPYGECAEFPDTHRHILFAC